jgi:type II secretory pathway pseudopilin PulG
MSPRLRIRSAAGMSLIEATIVLSVIALLAAIMAPSVSGYVDTARQARAREDVHTIAEAIQQFITDNGESFFLLYGHGTNPENPPDRSDTFRLELLVSDGDIPTLGSGVSTETYWTQAVDPVNNYWIDTLANQLAQNTPLDDSSLRYRNPSDITIASPGGHNIDFARSSSSGFNAPYAWRGAYMSAPVRPDPWGNRYAVNVLFMQPATSSGPTAGTITAGFATTDYPRLDVFVLSPGPDEEIDTMSAQDGAVPGDDDFIYIVSPNAK